MSCGIAALGTVYTMSEVKAAEASDRPHYDVPPPYSATAPPQHYYDPGSQPQQYNPPGQSFPQHQQYAPQHPQPMQPPQVIVRVIQNPNFSGEPARVICQFCQADIRTRVRRKNNLTTHVSALLLLFFCCPLFWIPYCCDCCKNSVHECPACDRFLGEYRVGDRRRY